MPEPDAGRDEPLAAGGAGGALFAGAGGAAREAGISLRYEVGAQPEVEPFLTRHHPVPPSSA